MLAWAFGSGVGLAADPEGSPVEECTRPAPLPPCNHWASRSPLGPANEVHVAVNPLDPLHLLVVAKDYGLGANADCRPDGALHVASASYVTRDGGLTWKTSRVPAPYPNGGGELSPLPFKCGSDPVALFGPEGTAYYVLLNFQYTGGRQAAIAVARSPDGGETWPASEIRVVDVSPGDDKQWGAVDATGRVHVAWTETARGEIRYARSDTSFAFESARVVARAGGGNPGVTVGTGPGGEVYLFWRAATHLKVMRSLDAGATFEEPRTALVTVPFEERTFTPGLPFFPTSAVDAHPSSPWAGRLYLAWTDRRLAPDAAGAGPYGSIFVASSGDGGATWTPPRRVDGGNPPRMGQVTPALSVAPNGRVDAAWLEQSGAASCFFLSCEGGDLPLGGVVFNTFASSSLDGGLTWDAPRLVSEAPLLAPLSRHQNGNVFVGDYIGIASTDEFAWPAFPGNGVDRPLEGLPVLEVPRVDAYLAPLRAPGPDGTGGET